LVELLVVLVVLGLIISIATPQVMKYLGSAQSDAAQIQIQRLSSILDLYRLDVGRYPSTEEGLDALVHQPPNHTNWNGPYITRSDQILDAWGRPYEYRHPGQHGSFDLYSLGADGI